MQIKGSSNIFHTLCTFYDRIRKAGVSFKQVFRTEHGSVTSQLFKEMMTDPLTNQQKTDRLIINNNHNPTDGCEVS